MRTIDKENIIGATLLTLEEAENIPKKYRRCSDWWWLRTCGMLQDTALAIGQNGHINYYGYTVDQCLGVRPVLICKNIEAEVGDIYYASWIKFIYIGNNRLLAKDTVGIGVFRTQSHCKEIADNPDEWYMENKPFNDYETSDVKKYVDDWLINLIR